MDNAHIFRIENADGTGLYGVSGYAEWLFSNNDGEDESTYDCDHTDRRPTPIHDHILMADDRSNPFYGFKNLKQLKDWVGSQAMNKISEHPETDIIHGEKQSIMTEERCKLVDVIQGHSISEYLKYGNSGKVL